MPFRLIELGPGRGTLLVDILRVVSKFDSEKQLKDIHLVETSPEMRARQKSTLQAQSEELECSLHWHDSIYEIPHSDYYSMVLAHEFFDAMPFHLLQKGRRGWHEVLIASSLDPVRDPRTGQNTPEIMNSENTSSYPRLCPVLSRTTSVEATILGSSSPRFSNIPVDASIEVSPISFKISRQIGKLLSTADTAEDASSHSGGGGCGLIIDYGGLHAFGNSFRAFKNHKIVDVFQNPGECDLTTNVDFAFLKEAMMDLVTVHGPLPQKEFLENMGLQLRLSRLLGNAETEERRSAIQLAANRLVDPSGMGNQYQVMGFTSAKNRSGLTSEVWPFVSLRKIFSQE